MCQVNRAADVQKGRKIQTEGDLIDKQSTRKDLFSSVLIPLSGSHKQLIVMSMHLVSICHGEDQFPVKAGNREVYQKDNVSQMQTRRTGRDGPPTGVGVPTSEKGIHAPSPVSSGGKKLWQLGEGYGQASGVLDANVHCFLRVPKPSSNPS